VGQQQDDGQAKNHEKLSAWIAQKQWQMGCQIKSWTLEWKQVESFRYRMADTQSVTWWAMANTSVKETAT